MRVHIPTPLRTYTDNQSSVEASGSTLGEMLADLDRRYPGMRFRIVNEQNQVREHILIFVNHSRVIELPSRLEPGDEIRIVPAISGG